MAYNAKGLALEASGQYDSALENYDKALELNPSYSQARNNRVHALMRLKDYRGAMESFLTL